MYHGHFCKETTTIKANLYIVSTTTFIIQQKHKHITAHFGRTETEVLTDHSHTTELMHNTHGKSHIQVTLKSRHLHPQKHNASPFQRSVG
jgi:hypothetical protein